MVITVEDYAEIRRLVNYGSSKRAIAKKLGISRNTVDKCVFRRHPDRITEICGQHFGHIRTPCQNVR